MVGLNLENNIPSYGDYMNKGLIHLYYGNGKGKTTAAFGLALRASGRGKKVVIVQFLKSSPSGEITALKNISNITILRGKGGTSFTFSMDKKEREETYAIHNQNFSAAIELAKTEKCQLLILDEVLDAIQAELLDYNLFSQFLYSKPEQLEIVITGHNPGKNLLEIADYVTEMVNHKHPYDKGIPAREGIEY